MCRQRSLALSPGGPAETDRHTDGTSDSRESDKLTTSGGEGGGSGRRADTITCADDQEIYGLAGSRPQHYLNEYFQVKLSEPCAHGSLKLVHSSFVFLQEVAGIKTSSRTRPCTSYPQGSSSPWLVQESLRDRLLDFRQSNVVSEETPIYWRIQSWWLLLQSLGNLEIR